MLLNKHTIKLQSIKLNSNNILYLKCHIEHQPLKQTNNNRILITHWTDKDDSSYSYSTITKISPADWALKPNQSSSASLASWSALSTWTQLRQTRRTRVKSRAHGSVRSGGLMTDTTAWARASAGPLVVWRVRGLPAPLRGRGGTTQADWT